MSLFGSTNPSGGGGLFGTKPGGTTGGLFGSSNTGATTGGGGGLFGSSNTGATTGGGGLFGSSNTGATTGGGGGLFGSSNVNNTNTGATTSSGGLFGSTKTGTAGGGLFSSSNTGTGSTTGGGLFSKPAGTTSGGLFGSSTATGGSGVGGSGLFGTTTTGTTAGGLFGPTTNTSTSTGGLFGNTATQQNNRGPFAYTGSVLPGSVPPNNNVIIPADLMERMQREIGMLSDYPKAPEFVAVMEHNHAEKCSITNVEKKAEDLLERQERFRRALEVTVSTLLERIKSRHKALQKQFLTVVGMMEDTASLQGTYEVDATAMSAMFEQIMGFQHRLGQSSDGELRRLDMSINELDAAVEKATQREGEPDGEVIESIIRDREDQLRDLGRSIAMFKQQIDNK